MPDPFRACIIGTGRIGSLLNRDPLRPGDYTHAGAYIRCPDYQLRAGADINSEHLQAFADDFKIPAERLYSDYQDMLEKERPDIVSVCAYAPDRLAMSRAALEAGAKGLWLEKSLGCSLGDAAAIQALLEKHNAVGIVDYPRRGRPHFRKIKELIEQKTFGRLQSVTCHMTHQLIHTGTHAFDVIRYWCGEATSVTGQLENPIEPGNTIVDQGGSGQIQTSSGTQVFVSAYRKNYYIFQFDLIFDQARILIGNDIAKVYQPAPSKLYSGFTELFETPDFDWSASPARPMLPELAHCIRTGETPLYSVENAIESLRIALAIFDSAKQGGIAIDPQNVDPSFHIPNH